MILASDHKQELSKMSIALRISVNTCTYVFSRKGIFGLSDKLNNAKIIGRKIPNNSDCSQSSSLATPPPIFFSAIKEKPAR